MGSNEITNPALSESISGLTPGQGIAFYIATLWRTVVIIGGVAFLLYLVWGGIEMMTAGGDKNKTQEAQQKISNGIIGLTILVASYAIILFVQNVLKINILQPALPNNL